MHLNFRFVCENHILQVPAQTYVTFYIFIMGRHKKDKDLSDKDKKQSAGFLSNYLKLPLIGSAVKKDEPMDLINGKKRDELPPGIDTAAFCHALEYMIVYTCTQSDTERSGKKVGEILTTNRSLLKDVEVEKLLFLEENLPFLHEIDFDKLVDRYITWSTTEGRRLQSPTLETSFQHFKKSAVLQRLQKQKSMGFLFK